MTNDTYQTIWLVDVLQLLETPTLIKLRVDIRFQSNFQQKDNAISDFVQIPNSFL